MLGTENSKEALESAIKELEEIKYLLVLADAEKFNKNLILRRIHYLNILVQVDFHSESN